MSYLNRLFTWWNRATLSTSLWTLVYGERVGEDEFGNVYYRTRGGKIDPALGFERRWVIYNGYRRRLQYAHGLVWLAASHRRHAAHQGIIHAQGVATAVPGKHDRHALGLPSAGLTAVIGTAPGRERRLRRLAPGGLKASSHDHGIAFVACFLCAGAYCFLAEEAAR